MIDISMLADKILEFFLDKMGNWDLRWVAFIVATIGIILGIIAPFYILLFISAAIIIVTALYIKKSFEEAKEMGGSGPTGLFLMSFFGALSFLIPLWLSFLLKHLI